MNDSHTIVLASGGTGGHIFPATALAEELLKRGFSPVLITDERFHQYQGNAEKEAGYRTYTIQSSTPNGHLLKKLRACLQMGAGLWQARKLLKSLRPKAVVGFGGYPSFPTMAAAMRLGIPTVIHEQNSVCGRVNSWLAPHARLIATSFPQVLRITEKDKAKIIMTGNPVRNAIQAISDVPYPALSFDGILRVLVVGGSQGAHIFSQIIPEALGLLPESYRKRIRIDQQCRREDIEETRVAYANLDVSADLAPFFTDIPARLAASHLVISRAGASTLAELTVAGRPGILVPYPHATDNHQAINANMIEQAGAGWVIPQEAFTAANLSSRLEAFLNGPESLEKAAAKAKELGMPNAALKLADAVESVVWKQ